MPQETERAVTGASKILTQNTEVFNESFRTSLQGFSIVMRHLDAIVWAGQYGPHDTRCRPRGGLSPGCDEGSVQSMPGFQPVVDQTRLSVTACVRLDVLKEGRRVL